MGLGLLAWPSGNQSIRRMFHSEGPQLVRYQSILKMDCSSKRGKMIGKGGSWSHKRIKWRYGKEPSYWNTTWLHDYPRFCAWPFHAKWFMTNLRLLCVHAHTHTHTYMWPDGGVPVVYDERRAAEIVFAQAWCILWCWRQVGGTSIHKQQTHQFVDGERSGLGFSILQGCSESQLPPTYRWMDICPVQSTSSHDPSPWQQNNWPSKGHWCWSICGRWD